MPKARLCVADIACWVIKSRTPPPDLLAGWSRGETRQLTRCIRANYRVEVMEPGQRCLLWLSGQRQPGVQAIGTLSTPASRPSDSGPDDADLAVTASLRMLLDPVPRASWLSDHELSRAEVIRIPLGSNPSYLDPERFSVLRTFISPRDLVGAGW